MICYIIHIYIIIIVAMIGCFDCLCCITLMKLDFRSPLRGSLEETFTAWPPLKRGFSMRRMGFREFRTAGRSQSRVRVGVQDLMTLDTLLWTLKNTCRERPKSKRFGLKLEIGQNSMNEYMNDMSSSWALRSFRAS